MLACGGFVLWTAQIWGGYDSDGYWKLIGLVTAWALALLVATTARLMTGLAAARCARCYPATAGAAAGAALVASVMLLRENGDGWQLFAVLLILALLGEALTPILERYAGEPTTRPAERLLGVVAGAEVLAVRGRREAGPDRRAAGAAARRRVGARPRAVAALSSVAHGQPRYLGSARARR